MNCAAVQEQILECFDGDQRRPTEIVTHMAECASCTQFYEAQLHLHDALANHLEPPTLSRDFQTSLFAKVKRERRRQIWNWVPDVVHFSGGLVTTITCALLLPQTAGMVVGVGLGFTLFSYVVSIFVGSWLEDDGL
jgi:predicted anti-sigma-YlaC factor YlaD